MLTQEEFDYVVKLLRHALAGNFAFHITDNGYGMPATVKYVQDYGGWSCLVNLVQYLGSIGVDPTGQTIYVVGNGAYDGAARGMCRFFNMNVRIVNYTGGYSDGMLQFAYQYMDETPFAEFRRVDPGGLLSRQELDVFVNLRLGPDPNVTLQGYDQTHLHRIYMALAFRRVRRKFEAHEKGLAIAAILVNANDGKIRAIAHNTKNVNVTYHAEVNIVQALLKYHHWEKDSHFIFYTTLQPCPMCAAMIAEKLPNATVFYGQSDPGDHMLRMETQPRLIFSLQNTVTIEEELNEDVTVTHYVKPLRGYGAMGQQAYTDVVAYLDNAHAVLHQAGSRALTRNLYNPVLKQGIINATKTLDRKINQYHHNQKPVVVHGDQARTNRRAAIQRVVEHILPLLN